MLDKLKLPNIVVPDLTGFKVGAILPGTSLHGLMPRSICLTFMHVSRSSSHTWPTARQQRSDSLNCALGCHLSPCSSCTLCCMISGRSTYGAIDWTTVRHEAHLNGMNVAVCGVMVCGVIGVANIAAGE